MYLICMWSICTNKEICICKHIIYYLITQLQMFPITTHAWWYCVPATHMSTVKLALSMWAVCIHACMLKPAIPCHALSGMMWDDCGWISLHTHQALETVETIVFVYIWTLILYNCVWTISNGH